MSGSILIIINCKILSVDRDWHIYYVLYIMCIVISNIHFYSTSNNIIYIHVVSSCWKSMYHTEIACRSIFILIDLTAAVCFFEPYVKSPIQYGAILILLNSNQQQTNKEQTTITYTLFLYSWHWQQTAAQAQHPTMNSRRCLEVLS